MNATEKQELPETYRHRLTNDQYYEMALVRAGAFIMGSDREESASSEKPAHLVRLTRDFYIGIYPVTQAIWKFVMNGQRPSWFTGDNRPVENVSWLDIVGGYLDDDHQPPFLRRLNNGFPAASGWRFRLPTEAEWEYAARGGEQIRLDAAKGGHPAALTDTEDLPKASELYTLYAGSDKLKEVGWFGQNSHGETKKVGLKAPNELGLYDMSGNVFEWCWDWSDIYEKTDYYLTCQKQGIVEDPVGPKDGQARILRGGSWRNDGGRLRVSYRGGSPPGIRASNFGFRLVLASPQRMTQIQWRKAAAGIPGGAFRTSKVKSGIKPYATVHTLRHSFATYPLERGRIAVHLQGD